MRILFRHLCLLIVFVLLWSGVSSQAEPGPELAFSDSWFLLNYYHRDHNGQISSEITNRNYFFSEVGATDPQAELAAYLKAVSLFHETGAGQGKLCRYPARYSFLEKYIPRQLTGKRPVCDDYESLMQPSRVKSLSIIYADGYFGNPSSYYGHILLKSNYAQNSGTNFFDPSLNYGAHVTDSTSNPLYIYRGLFGGYTASYKPNHYFRHSQNYTNAQLRDLWDYELDLTDQEVRFVLERSYELLNAEFRYYFVNDNCAHRIARLVEDATGKPLTTTTGFWLTPVQVIRNLEDTHRGSSRNLIRSEHYVPSLQTRFNTAYLQLSREERRVFDHFFSETKSRTTAPDLLGDLRLLRLGLDYLDIQKAGLDSGTEDIDGQHKIESKRRLLLAALMVSSPDASPSRNETKPPHAAQKGQYPSLLQVQGVERKNHTALNIGLRVAYNDLLNHLGGQQPASRFIMGEVSAEISPEDIDLEKLTLLDILDFRLDPLPFDLSRKFSWSLTAQYDRLTPICSNCSAWALRYQAGLARKLGDRTIAYALIGGQLQSSVSNSGIVAITSEYGLTGKLPLDIRFSLFGLSRNYFTERNPDVYFGLDLSRSYFRANEIRAGIGYGEGHSRLTLSLRHYFD